MKHFRPDTPRARTPPPPPSRLPHVDVLACRHLWCAVLLTALLDLCNTHPRSSARVAAERWVGDRPDRNFTAVCTMAGMDPRRVHARLRAILALPAAERRSRIETVAGRIGPQARCTGQCDGQDGGRQEAPRAVRMRSGADQQPAPLAPTVRRARVAALFTRGVAPSDMPGRLAKDGHAVSMDTIWNDIRYLRAKNLVGYIRNPRAHRRACRVREEHRP